MSSHKKKLGLSAAAVAEQLRVHQFCVAYNAASADHEYTLYKLVSLHRSHAMVVEYDPPSTVLPPPPSTFPPPRRRVEGLDRAVPPHPSFHGRRRLRVVSVLPQRRPVQRVLRGHTHAGGQGQGEGQPRSLPHTADLGSDADAACSVCLTCARGCCCLPLCCPLCCPLCYSQAKERGVRFSDGNVQQVPLEVEWDGISLPAIMTVTQHSPHHITPPHHTPSSS